MEDQKVEFDAKKEIRQITFKNNFLGGFLSDALKFVSTTLPVKIFRNFLQIYITYFLANFCFMVHFFLGRFRYFQNGCSIIWHLKNFY